MPELKIDVKKITDRFLHDIPAHPGVYIMKDIQGNVMYIGKSNNLRSRVKQYFRKSGDTRVSVTFIRRNVTSIEFFLTDTEKEAIILENNLIKKLVPRYNIRLKDDKNFLKIRINIKEDFPALQLVRRVKEDGALYFGPYSSSRDIKSTLQYLQMVYPLRNCRDSVFKTRSRPCLYFQMGKCLGPCCGNVSREEYHAMLKEVIMFLRGQKTELLEQLKEKMNESALNQVFEQAAVFRDRIFAIERSLEKQAVVSNTLSNKDVIGLCYHEKWVSFNVLQIRKGRLDLTENFILAHNDLPEEEILASFMQQFYQQRPIPESVVVKDVPAGCKAVEEWLGDKKHGRVTIICATRGENLRMLKMAQKSARQNLISKKEREVDLELLKKRFHLKNTPHRIECYDISNFQGEAAVGSSVVFVDCFPKKNLYRKYKIRTLSGQNDFAMLAEVMSRRLKRAAEEKNYPDLCIIDGGKAQLAAVYAMYEQQKETLRHIDFISLAKESDSAGKTDERVYLINQKNPIFLKEGTEEKKILDRIRDEAHRFAVTYHRKLRSKSRLSSEVLGIPGIGEYKEKLLIIYFKSAKKVKSASLEELKQVKGIGINTAAKIYRYFHPDII